MNTELDRKLTTILCADVSGYSRLMNIDEEKTLNRLKETRKIFQNFIRNYNGRMINMTGDGLICEFSSVVKAVQCAVEVQNRINKDNTPLPSDNRMLYRIGINLGDVIIEGEDIFGEGVNVAARLEALAPVGGICISGSVFEQVKNKLPRDFKFLGSKAVKNIAEPVPVYSLSLTETPTQQTTKPNQSTEPAHDAADINEDDEKIRAYVKKQAAFYRKAVSFGILVFILFVINMATSPGYWWFLWPAIPIFLLLLKDAIQVYGHSYHTKDWEERKVTEIKSRANKKTD